MRPLAMQELSHTTVHVNDRHVTKIIDGTRELLTCACEFPVLHETQNWERAVCDVASDRTKIRERSAGAPIKLTSRRTLMCVKAKDRDLRGAERTGGHSSKTSDNSFHSICIYIFRIVVFPPAATYAATHTSRNSAIERSTSIESIATSAAARASSLGKTLRIHCASDSRFFIS